MRVRRSHVAAAVCAAFAAAAAPAIAAPDHNAVLGVDKPSFEWQGAAQVSPGLLIAVRENIPCKTPVARPCEDVLFQIKDPGKLTIKVDGGPGGAPEDDVDLFVYQSDQSGAPGKQVAAGQADGVEKVSITVVPGYYLAQVDYYRSKNSGYKGSASFAGTAPPVVVAPAPPAVATPAQSAPAPKPSSASKKRAAKRKCEKAAKKIKNGKRRKKALKRCAARARR